jgi:hypothetical protein
MNKFTSGTMGDMTKWPNGSMFIPVKSLTFEQMVELFGDESISDAAYIALTPEHQKTEIGKRVMEFAKLNGAPL